MAPFQQIMDEVYEPIFKDHTLVEKVNYENAKKCLENCIDEAHAMMREKFPDVVHKVSLFEQKDNKQFIVILMMHLDDGIRYMLQNFSWRDDVTAASTIVRVTQKEWH